MLTDIRLDVSPVSAGALVVGLTDMVVRSQEQW